MLGALGQIMNSEYTNPTDLIGVNGEIERDVDASVNALPPVKKSQAVGRMTKRHIPSQGSRAEFEKFFPELSQPIKDQIRDGKLRLADILIYTIKPVSGAKTIKMFESQDVKEVGMRNISNAKLPKNMALLVSGIYLLQGQAPSLDVDGIKTTVFNTIETVGALANGEFRLKANKKQLVSDTSNRSFVTADFHNVPKGFYKLANPRLIQDDIDIEFEIELGTITGINPNTVIYVALAGTATIP